MLDFIARLFISVIATIACAVVVLTMMPDIRKTWLDIREEQKRLEAEKRHRPTLFAYNIYTYDRTRKLIKIIDLNNKRTRSNVNG